MAQSKELRRALRNSTIDGTASSVTATITGNYITPFALSLGADAGAIGLLNSIPKLAGTIVQPFVGRFIKFMGGRKPTCNTMTLIGRLLLIPIALIPFFFTTNPVWWLIGLLSLSQLASNIAVTAWASWIGDLVPQNIMGRFFGRRNSIGGMAAFLTTLGAGVLLTRLNGTFGFTTIFLLAVVAGLISNFYLRRIPEPAFHDGHQMSSPISEFRSELRKNHNFKRFIFYISSFYLATYIASPFFAVSMLKDFNIGYEAYAMVIAFNMLAAIISQPYWGRLADRFGDRAVLAVCAVFATLVPGLWLFVQEPVGMMFVYMFSGFAWAGFDLATFNYLLGATSHKPSYIANYSMLTGLAIVAGPLIGGALAESGIAVVSLVGLSAVFLVSFALRAIFSTLMMPGLAEVRPAKWVPPVQVLLWKSLTVYPFRFLTHEMSVAQHYIYRHRPRR
jgi:MFS family permease